MPASDPLCSPWGCLGAAGGRAGSDWRSRITPWPALLQAWRGRQRGGGEKNGLKIACRLRHTAEPLPWGISWAACCKTAPLLFLLSPVCGAPLGHFGVRIWGVWGHSWVTLVAASLGTAVRAGGGAPKWGSLYGGSSEHFDVLECVCGMSPVLWCAGQTSRLGAG